MISRPWVQSALNVRTLGSTQMVFSGYFSGILMGVLSFQLKQFESVIVLGQIIGFYSFFIFPTDENRTRILNATDSNKSLNQIHCAIKIRALK